MHNPHKAHSKLDPQREDGNRQIESSVYRALIFAGLSGPEYQIVHLIIDKTWGWRKTSDVIPLSQFEEATNLQKRNIITYLKRLEDKLILIISRSGPGRGKGNSYMFNKYWDTWKIFNVSLLHYLDSNGVPYTPINESSFSPEEMVSDIHQLDSKGVRDTPLNNSVPATPFKEGNGVDSAGNGVAHTPGNGVAHTPSKEIINKLSKENSLYIYQGQDVTCALIATLYEENIGVIKPALRDELVDFSDNHEVPPAWIEAAFREAIVRNRKSWGYVRSILENYEERGGPDDESRDTSIGRGRSRTYLRGDKAPTRERYQQSLER